MPCLGTEIFTQVYLGT